MSNTTPPGSELQISRDFFLGGYTVQYDLVLQNNLSPSELLKLCDSFINHLIPTEALHNGKVRDLKGRDAGNSIDGSTIQSTHPASDEILYIAGLAPAGSHHNEDSNNLDSALEKDSFSITISSKFDAFDGSSHIIHKCERITNGPLPEGFSIPHLASFPELTISAFRLGLDVFQAHSFAVFGFAPFVGQTLLIEIGSNNIKLRVCAERLKSRTSLPLGKFELLKKLNAVLIQHLNFDLTADYQAKTT